MLVLAKSQSEQKRSCIFKKVRSYDFSSFETKPEFPRKTDDKEKRKQTAL